MAEGSSAVSTALENARHFAITVAIPSLIATVYPLLLLAAGAPQQAPDPRLALDAVRNINLAGFGLLLIVVVAVGLVLQPLQFALTQLLEGYWGAWGVMQRAMMRSSRRHLDRLLSLQQSGDDAAWKVEDFDAELAQLTEHERELDLSGKLTLAEARRISKGRSRLLHRSLADRIAAQEADRAAKRYPSDPAEILPTRLGNMLRRYEREAGAPFGLDAVLAAALLAQTGNQTLRGYYDDARTDLDLATQMVLVWTLSTIGGFVLLWSHGSWMLLVLATSLLVGLSYIGTIAAAEAYGEALKAIVALGRFDLYRQLGLEAPRNSEVEIEQNDLVNRQLQGVRAPVKYVTYRGGRGTG